MDVSSESEKPVEVLKATFYQKATRWLWLQKAGFPLVNSNPTV